MDKFRLYRCPNGHECHRPLTIDPKPCDVCRAPLVGLPSTVEDATLWMRDFIERANDGPCC